jgi:serine/threonine protein phosphatase 1
LIYAIADIHGQKAMLDHALALIAADGGPDAQIVFLGDYTDRGPDSRGVIATLMAGCAAGRPWTCVKGNHDRMFTRYVRQGTEHDPQVKSHISWLNPRLGGDKTLASYGVSGELHFQITPDGQMFSGHESLLFMRTAAGNPTPAEVLAQAQSAVPESHIAFLEGLPLFHQTDDLLFVHAGIRPGVPLAAQAEDDLLWIRDGFLDDTRDHGRLVVHGHTALETPAHFGNRVDLDGGAGYFRPLVPAVFVGRDCWLLTDKGRVRLAPPR